MEAESAAARPLPTKKNILVNTISNITSSLQVTQGASARTAVEQSVGMVCSGRRRYSPKCKRYVLGSGVHARSRTTSVSRDDHWVDGAGAVEVDASEARQRQAYRGGMRIESVAKQNTRSISITVTHAQCFLS